MRDHDFSGTATAEDSGRRYLLEELERVAHAMVRTLGENFCEVVIHHFDDPDHSIVWIEGNVTQRSRGGSMSQIGLRMMEAGNDAGDEINYITHTRDGKVLKSSTVPIRDLDGQVFGALCVNLDITNLVGVERALRSFIASGEAPAVSNIQFSDTSTDVAKVMVDEALEQRELVGALLTMEQRLELIESLNQLGYFRIRHSINLLAEKLGVSRASIYNYLKEVRNHE